MEFFWRLFGLASSPGEENSSMESRGRKRTFEEAFHYEEDQEDMMPAKRSNSGQSTGWSDEKPNTSSGSRGRKRTFKEAFHYEEDQEDMMPAKRSNSGQSTDGSDEKPNTSSGSRGRKRTFKEAFHYDEDQEDTMSAKRSNSGQSTDGSDEKPDTSSGSRGRKRKFEEAFHYEEDQEDMMPAKRSNSGQSTDGSDEKPDTSSGSRGRKRTFKEAFHYDEDQEDTMSAKRSNSGQSTDGSDEKPDTSSGSRGRKRKFEEAFHYEEDQEDMMPAKRSNSGQSTDGSDEKPDTSSGSRGRKRTFKEAFHYDEDQEDTMSAKRSNSGQSTDGSDEKPDTSSGSRGRKRKFEEAFHYEEDQEDTMSAKRSNSGQSTDGSDEKPNISSGSRGRKRTFEEAFHYEEDQEDMMPAKRSNSGQSTDGSDEKPNTSSGGRSSRDSFPELVEDGDRWWEEMLAKLIAGEEGIGGEHNPLCPGSSIFQSFGNSKSVGVNLWAGLPDEGDPSSESALDNYEIRRKLREEKTGYVYLATRKSDGKKVALKFVHRSDVVFWKYAGGYPNGVIEEAAVMFALKRPPRCPHIIELYDYFQVGEYYVLVLEHFQPSMTLHAFIRRNGGRLSESVARRLTLQILIAVQACLQHHVGHGAINQDNILVNPKTLEVKLINFSSGDLKLGRFKEELGEDGMYTKCSRHYYVDTYILTDMHIAVDKGVLSVARLLARMVNGFWPLRSVNYHPRFHSSVSKECRDLLKKAFKVLVFKGPTVKEMINHRWFSMKDGSDEKPNTSSGSRGRKRTFEEAFHYEEDQEDMMPAKRSNSGQSTDGSDEKPNTSSVGSSSSSSGDSFQELMEDCDRWWEKMKSELISGEEGIGGEHDPPCGVSSFTKTIIDDEPIGLETWVRLPDESDPSSESALDNYEIGRRLRKETSGSVYLATRKSDGKKVAMKFVHRSNNFWWIYAGGYPNGVIEEAAVMFALKRPPRCPHIIELYDYFQVGSYYVLVLEQFQPSVPLYAFIKRNGGRLSESVARHLTLQILIAVQACLQHHVGHGAIDQDSILVNPLTLEVKLINFSFGQIKPGHFIEDIGEDGMHMKCSRHYHVDTDIWRPLQFALEDSVLSVARLLAWMVNGFWPLRSLYDHPRFHSSVSKECRDLLTEAFKVLMLEGPTVEEMINHRWFRMKDGSDEKPSTSSGSRGRKRKFKEAFHYEEDQEDMMSAKRSNSGQSTDGSDERPDTSSVGSSSSSSGDSFQELMEDCDRWWEKMKSELISGEEGIGGEHDPPCGVSSFTKTIIDDEPIGLETWVRLPDEGDPSSESTLDNYEIGRKLRKETSGSVYLATRKSDGKKVALKFIHRSNIFWWIYAGGYPNGVIEEAAVRFALKRPPRCPHIIELYDYFQVGHYYVLVLEHFQPSMTLAAFIRRNGGRLSESVARRLTLQILIAVQACLQHHVGHGAINQDNILVNPKTLEVKLIDFSSGQIKPGHFIEDIGEDGMHTKCSRHYHVDTDIWRPLQFALEDGVLSVARLLARMVNGFWPLRSVYDHPRFHSSVSKECRDLLTEAFKVRMLEGPTVEEMINHRWFSMK